MAVKTAEYYGLTRDNVELFLGGRIVQAGLKKYIDENNILNKGTFYRGIPIPKKELKIGFILEEWNCMCHFSKSKKIAEEFADVEGQWVYTR